MILRSAKGRKVTRWQSPIRRVILSAIRLGEVSMRVFAAVLAGALALAAASGAQAQKSGGILRMYFQDNPPSASIHEEATTSTVVPFMGLYNNLVVFDPAEAAEQPRHDRARPRRELDAGTPTARSSPSSCARASKWHDGKPFTSADVKCTWDMLKGKGERKLRRNPRTLVVRQPREGHDQRRQRGRPSISSSRSRRSWCCSPRATRPVYPCHVPAGADAHQADRHRPVQARRVQAATKHVKLAAQPRLLEEGPALSRRHRLHDRAQPRDARSWASSPAAST